MFNLNGDKSLTNNIFVLFGITVVFYVKNENFKSKT